MAVGWKHKDKKDSQRANMTQMELARAERQQRENRLRAIGETKLRAAELFKKVKLVLQHPTPVAPLPPCDERTVARHQAAVRRWEFECLAVIRLASEDMRASKFVRKYSWNHDWQETGCLTMGRNNPQPAALQPVSTDKSDTLKFVPIHHSV